MDKGTLQVSDQSNRMADKGSDGQDSGWWSTGGGAWGGKTPECQ